MRAGLESKTENQTVTVADGFEWSEEDINTIENKLEDIQRTVNQNNGALGDTVEQALTIGEHGFTDLEDRLERIEAMTQEATNAAQSADNKLDNLH
ncbi:hypothetical protein [Halorubrum tailed virus BLv36]|nr:hypothetical protein [Halorubrum tailed virus BLv36]